MHPAGFNRDHTYRNREHSPARAVGAPGRGASHRRHDCGDFELSIKLGSLGVPLLSCAGFLYQHVPVPQVFLAPGQKISIAGAQRIGGQLMVGDAEVAAANGATLTALRAGVTTVWIDGGSVTCRENAYRDLPTKDCVLFEMIVS
jgi:hypothetical protein